MRKKAKIFVLAGLFILALFGCTVKDLSKGTSAALDYTVVKEEDLPDELRAVIEEKKEREFQMTYQSENFLYLLRGYGRQMSGGFSISVEDLSLCGGAIVFETMLLGPKEEERVSKEPSYPYIVVKTEDRKEPVQFR